MLAHWENLPSILFLKSLPRKQRQFHSQNPESRLALEFKDGKIMLGNMVSLENIDYNQILQSAGEGPFIDLMSKCDLVSIVNWTMIPKMTSILQNLLIKFYLTCPQEITDLSFLTSPILQSVQKRIYWRFSM